MRLERFYASRIVEIRRKSRIKELGLTPEGVSWHMFQDEVWSGDPVCWVHWFAQFQPSGRGYRHRLLVHYQREQPHRSGRLEFPLRTVEDH